MAMPLLPTWDCGSRKRCWPGCGRHPLPMIEAVAPSLVNDATIMFGRNFTPQKELLEKITMPVLALSGDVDMLPGVDTSFFRKGRPGDREHGPAWEISSAPRPKP